MTIYRLVIDTTDRSVAERIARLVELIPFIISARVEIK